MADAVSTFNFGLYDIKQPATLAKEIQGSKKVFSYWGSGGLKGADPNNPINGYDGSGVVTLSVKRAMVSVLNDLLTKVDLYTKVSATINLTQKTTQDAKANPQAGTAKLASLNRRILEETYPSILGLAPSRMNYFDRQFLRSTDFKEEQSYQMLRRKLHNRLLHTPGVAEGLDVSASGATAILVTSGTAIDADGNELVLSADTTVSLPTTFAANSTSATVYISYAEQPAAPSTDSGVSGYTRVSEIPQITINDDTSTSTVPSGIKLAQLTLVAGQWKGVITTTVRQYSGVPATSLKAQQLTLADATTTTGVSISYGPTNTASVSGHLSVNGNTVVKGAITPSAGNSTNNGIVFPGDPGGGAGDIAYMRYYNRKDEACTLEIGIQNDVDDHIALMPSGNVGIGTITPTQKLDVSGNVNISGSLTAGNTTVNALSAASAGISGRLTAGNTTVNALSAASAGISGSLTAGNTTVNALSAASAGISGSLTVTGTLNAANATLIGSLTVSTILPSAGTAFQDVSKIQTPADGIWFPANPGGGAGDIAYMRYYPRSGEACTLEIGIQNDVDDHIALMPSGNVGIGTNAPAAKLDVLGNAKIDGALTVKSATVTDNLSVSGSVNINGSFGLHGKQVSYAGEASDKDEIAVPWGTCDNWAILLSPKEVGCMEGTPVDGDFRKNNDDNAIISIKCYAEPNSDKSKFKVIMKLVIKDGDKTNVWFSDEGNYPFKSQLKVSYLMVAKG